jgi:hypothetical protein
LGSGVFLYVHFIIFNMSKTCFIWLKCASCGLFQSPQR